MRLLHGSEQEYKSHQGICFTDSSLAAAEYGENVVEINIDLAGLKIVEVSALVDRDNMYWPGDRSQDLTDFNNQGIDVLFYKDETVSGLEHDTWRFISSKSLSLIS